MAQSKHNYRYCLKHTNHNNLVALKLFTPIDYTFFTDLKSFVYRVYCPTCNQFYYFNDANQLIDIQDHYYEQIKEKNQA